MIDCHRLIRLGIYSRQFSRTAYHENWTSSKLYANRGDILSGKFINTMSYHIFEKQASNRSSNGACDQSIDLRPQ